MRRASIWTARFIPAFLFLVVAYVSYIVVGPLSINYLIKPPGEDIPRRIAAGIAISIAHFALLIPVAICWLRLLLVVLRDPGYMPQNSDDVLEVAPELRPGLEAFWKKDVFVCDKLGMPIWCSVCHNWKPDRTHHSQDVGRCTRRMDHFCPWVGGVVGERSFKFFVQFLIYSMILTAYLTIVLAYFVSEYKRDVQIIVGLGLAGFFLLFTMGMVMNCMNLVIQNSTTIENISERMYLAVILPPELQQRYQATPILAEPSRSDSGRDSERPLTSDLDDPSHISYFDRPARPARRESQAVSKFPQCNKIWKRTVTYPTQLSIDRNLWPAPETRTFAILHTPEGLNPWNLGSVYLNFSQVFGTKPHEWFLPIRYSPCCDHSSMVSDFPLGPEFELLLCDAGLIRPESPDGKDTRSSTVPGKRRKRRLDAGWQNGERPDGWISEQKARRVRNEWRRRAKQGGQGKKPNSH